MYAVTKSLFDDSYSDPVEPPATFKDRICGLEEVISVILDKVTDTIPVRSKEGWNITPFHRLKTRIELYNAIKTNIAVYSKYKSENLYVLTYKNGLGEVIEYIVISRFKNMYKVRTCVVTK